MSRSGSAQGVSSPGAVPVRGQHVSQYSMISDGSIAEDLLASLHNFPHVPDPKVPTSGAHVPAIYEDEDEGAGPRRRFDALSPLAPLGAIAPANDKMLVDTSRLLHSHPGLLEEMYDPATHIHTFKIAYHARGQAELPSPESPGISHSSTSSPSLPSPETPQLYQYGSSSNASGLPSRERREASISARLGGYFLGGARPESASSSVDSASRQPFLSRKPLTSDAQHPPLQPPPSSQRPVQPSFPLPEGSARRPYPYQPLALDGVDPQLHPARTSAPSASRPSTASNSPSLHHATPHPARFMSPDELASYRQFLTQRAEDVITDARAFDPSPAPSNRPSPPHLPRDDGASDYSWDAESIASMHPSLRSHAPSSRNASPRRLPYLRPPLPVFPPSAGPAALQDDLMQALSALRAERARGLHGMRPDSATMGSTSSDGVGELYGAPPPATNRLVTQAPQPRRPVAPLPRVPASTGPPSPTQTVLSGFEDDQALQELLPEFLDLGADADTARRSLYGAPSVGLGASRLGFYEDERLASVPEGWASHSSVAGSERGEDEWADPVIAPVGMRPSLGPRKAHSTSDLSAGRRTPLRQRLPPQSYGHPQSAHPELETAYSHTRPPPPPPSRIPPPVPDSYGYPHGAPPLRRRPTLDRIDAVGMHPGPSSAPVRREAYEPEVLYARDRDGRLYEVDPREYAAALRERDYGYERRGARALRRELSYDDHRARYRDHEDLYQRDELEYEVERHEERYVVREREAYVPRDYMPHREHGQTYTRMRTQSAREDGTSLPRDHPAYRPHSRDSDSHSSHARGDPRYAMRDKRDHESASYAGPRGHPHSNRSSGHAPYSAPLREHTSYDDHDTASCDSLPRHSKQDAISPPLREDLYSTRDREPDTPRANAHSPPASAVHSPTRAMMSAREHNQQLLHQHGMYEYTPRSHIPSVVPSVAGDGEPYLREHRARDPASPPLGRSRSRSDANANALAARVTGLAFDGHDNGAFEAPRRAPYPEGARPDQGISVEKRHMVMGVLKPTPDIVAIQSLSTPDLSKAGEEPRKPASEAKVKGKADEDNGKEDGTETRAATPAPSLAAKKRPPIPEPDLYFAMGASPMGFSAMSFRTVKKLKPKKATAAAGAGPKSTSSQSSDGPHGKLRAAGMSVPEFKSSFIHVSVEEHAKPHKKGLFGQKKKAKEAE